MPGNCCPQVALPRTETNNLDSKCGIVQQFVGKHPVCHSSVLEEVVEGVHLHPLHRLRTEKEGFVGRPLMDCGPEIRSQSTTLIQEGSEKNAKENAKHVIHHICCKPVN